MYHDSDRESLSHLKKETKFIYITVQHELIKLVKRIINDNNKRNKTSRLKISIKFKENYRSRKKISIVVYKLMTTVLKDDEQVFDTVQNKSRRSQ